MRNAAIWSLVITIGSAAYAAPAVAPVVLKSRLRVNQARAQPMTRIKAPLKVDPNGRAPLYGLPVLAIDGLPPHQPEPPDITEGRPMTPGSSLVPRK